MQKFHIPEKYIFHGKKIRNPSGKQQLKKHVSQEKNSRPSNLHMEQKKHQNVWNQHIAKINQRSKYSG